MEGPDAKLDRKGDKNRPERNRRVEQRVTPKRSGNSKLLDIIEDDLLQRQVHRIERRAFDRQPLPQARQRDQIECWNTGSGGGDVEELKQEKHADRTGHGIDEEFKRSIVAALFRIGIGGVAASPSLNEEICRNQAEFPEDEEEEEIERQEVPQHCRFQQKHQRQVQFHPLCDAERRQHRHRSHRRRQDHQRHTDAVHPDEIIDPDCLHPWNLLDELHDPLPVGGGVRVEPDPDDNRQGKRDGRPRRCADHGYAIIEAQRACQRRQRQPDQG
jgi:hypothetical protein